MMGNIRSLANWIGSRLGSMRRKMVQLHFYTIIITVGKSHHRLFLMAQTTTVSQRYKLQNSLAHNFGRYSIHWVTNFQINKTDPKHLSSNSCLKITL